MYTLLPSNAMNSWSSRLPTYDVFNLRYLYYVLVNVTVFSYAILSTYDVFI